MSWTEWNGKAAEFLANEAQRGAVKRTLEDVLEAAKAEVPVLTGRLQSSGVVVMAPRREPAGVVAFGGGRGTNRKTRPHATRIHEKVRRYLADPFNRLALVSYQRHLRTEMDRRTR